MIRVMHFADTHFGVETHGRLDPATGLNSRLLDFERSLCAAIDIALERGVQLAVFAGDAYKSRDPSQTHQREFAECLRKLTERGVPIALLTGNHDVPNLRGRAHAMEIWRTLGVEGVHVLSAPELCVIETPAGPVQIAALPWLPRGFLLAREEFAGKSVTEAKRLMEERYAQLADELARSADPTLPTILLGHFWVAGAKLSEWQQSYLSVNEPQMPLEALAQTAFDYVALGHIHRHQDLTRGESPPVVYSGSPDCIDFGERSEPKGFVMVDLERGRTAYEFVPILGRRALLEIDVDADTETPTESILSEIAHYDLRNAIVRLTYHISPENLAAIRDRDIREALAPAFLVTAIRRDVARGHAARDRILTDSLDPRTALDRYVDQNDRLRPRKEELLRYAEQLFEELEREEASL